MVSDFLVSGRLLAGWGHEVAPAPPHRVHSRVPPEWGGDAMADQRRSPGGAVMRRQLLGALAAGGHGYAVRTATGETLGRLAALVYGRDDRWPQPLHLRPGGFRGLWSRRQTAVAFARVVDVVPTRREIVVSCGPAGPPAPRGIPDRRPRDAADPSPAGR